MDDGVTSRKVGMQKRGVASADHAVRFVSLRLIKNKRAKLTKCDNVAEGTEHSKVELSLLDLLATSKERDQDGSSVTQCQANDTNTGEGVEGSGGTKVDETQGDLNNHAKHHGVERNVELGVDSPPQLVTGDSAITGKGPSSARRSSGASNTTEQTQNEERNKQSDGSAG